MNSKIKKKTVIILCGGLGTRLGSLGKKIPKTLVKVNGKPIIWYIIKFMEKQSFNHFILPLGYKGNLIKRYFSKNTKNFKGVSIDLINTGNNTTIAKRIFFVKKFVKSSDFILLNGDAIFNFKIKNYYKEHVRSKNFITFLGCDAELSYGIVDLVKGNVKNFRRNAIFDKVQYSKQSNIISFVYSGISIMSKKLLNFSFKNSKNFEKEFYPQVIKKHKTGLRNINGFWHSIDNLKDIEDLTKSKNLIKFKKVFKLKNYILKG